MPARYYAPHRPPAVHHLRHLADDRVHHVPGDEPGRNAAVQRAELWDVGTYLGLQYAHGAVLADAVLRPAGPCHLPAGVPPWGKAGHVRRFVCHSIISIINMYKKYT